MSAMDWSAIDDLVIARLKAADLFRNVKSLDSVEQLMDDPSKQFPVAFTRIRAQNWDRASGQDDIQDGELVLEVYIKSRNVRADGSARKADNGAYALSSDVIDLLDGFSPSPCHALHPRQRSLVEGLTDRNQAVMLIVFTAYVPEE